MAWGAFAPLLAMKYEILLILASVTATIAIIAAIKLGMLAYEVCTGRNYSLKDKLGFFASLFIMIMGIASLGGVVKNAWDSIQKTNSIRQVHEEKLRNGIQEFDAKMKAKFKDEEYEWKRVE